MNNLKQLGQAILMYANDYDGKWMCYHWVTNVTTYYWICFLTPISFKSVPAYIPVPKANKPHVSVCPSEFPRVYVDRWKIYGINYSSYINVSPDDTNVVFLGSYPGYGDYRWIYIGRIKNPSNFVLLGDSFYLSAGSQYGFQLNYNAGGTNYSGIHFRHNGVANILFADGHVEACNPSRLKVCFKGGQTNTWPYYILGVNYGLTKERVPFNF
ncbi:MAG: hypothetical protein NC922_04730 [Candidatus Omnitrophica bacterium]|nr:hypothetical protein [Candidatus Omnitrophota bacterium]